MTKTLLIAGTIFTIAVLTMSSITSSAEAVPFIESSGIKVICTTLGPTTEVQVNCSVIDTNNGIQRVTLTDPMERTSGLAIIDGCINQLSILHQHTDTLDNFQGEWELSITDCTEPNPNTTTIKMSLDGRQFSSSD
ncbi:MAG: hypothetical protein OEL69_04375 [Nitrosopumilus sp.]|nr:hypothetical protein [Nitrosopumilus sp.]